MGNGISSIGLAAVLMVLGCTKAAQDSQSKIVNGTVDGDNGFQSVVEISFPDNTSCTASIIGKSESRLLLLTAAHCAITGPETQGQVMSWENIKILAGTDETSGDWIEGKLEKVAMNDLYLRLYNQDESALPFGLSDQNSDETVDRSVEFLKESRSYDVATLIVSIDSGRSNEFWPAPALQVGASADVEVGNSVALVGFGYQLCKEGQAVNIGKRRYGYNRVAEILNDNTVFKVESDLNETDQDSNSESFDSATACSGDSGGPAIRETSLGQSIVGVISTGLNIDQNRNTFFTSVKSPTSQRLLADSQSYFDSLTTYAGSEDISSTKTDAESLGNSSYDTIASCYFEADTSPSCFEFKFDSTSATLETLTNWCKSNGVELSSTACPTEGRQAKYCEKNTEGEDYQLKIDYYGTEISDWAATNCTAVGDITGTYSGL
jgi:hypothetical protein